MDKFEERARKAADALRSAVNETELKVDDGDRTAKRRINRRNGAIGGTAAVAVIGILAALLPTSAAHDSTPPVALGKNDGTFALAGALRPFNACDDALSYFRDNAAEFYKKQAGGGVLPMYAEDMPNAGGRIMPGNPGFSSITPDNSSDSSASATPAQAPSPQFSTTNVAEKGVDEPDIVKTDGNTIVTVTNAKARLLHVNGGNPKVAAVLPGDNVRNVLLSKDRLVVLQSNTEYNKFIDMPYYGANNVSAKSMVAIYDISNIDKPSLVSSIDVTGSIVDARMVGTQVRLVTNFLPDVSVSPEYGPTGQLTEESKRKLQDAINVRPIDQWLPTFTLHDASGATKATGQLVDCNNVGHPESFSGISTTALVTFDATGSLTDRHSAAVVASGDQLYANEDHLFVTSTQFAENGSNSSTTDVHQFSTGANGAVKYDGSGSVEGTLVNQYSMSEWNGSLRIASTTTGSQGWLNRRSVTEGRVTVLQMKNGSLSQVGLATGLGADDNETIGSVRFIGPRGYVTTSRVTDPLYVLNLKDATAPTVVGQLKVPGSSTYLHPISDKLLFSVGSKDASGGPLQAALYDVSDPANPRQIATQNYGDYQYGGGNFDPKAFLYWAPRDLIILPINVWTKDSQWSGLVLLSANDSGLTEVGRLKDVNPNTFDLLRTFVVDNNVYQLSNSSLQVNSLDTHKDTAKLTFQPTSFIRRIRHSCGGRNPESSSRAAVLGPRLSSAGHYPQG